MPPRILRLEEIRDEPVGGKATGLAQLHAMGLRVPRGFAIVDATPGELPEDLLRQYRDLGAGKVAVRSSALDEDSSDSSFAGQYETTLNVEGEQALLDAVRQCLASLSSERAGGYREFRGEEKPSERAMCVVVQCMVDARAAGVLFTVDPVTHRRAHMVLDAVAGLGEALVSGEATPDHYVLERDGKVVRCELTGETPILDDFTRKRLIAESLAAERERGTPLDLEWAIDGEGEVWWLQARPITTLGPDLNELDTKAINPDHVYTRCNIGEMFPGVCTPLSYSFTVWAIDVGMQRMQMRVGVQDEFDPELRFCAMSYGHLFLNLTTLSDAASQTLGGDASDLTLSICGRVITEPEIKLKPPPAWPRRVRNIARYFLYLFGQRRARRSLKNLVATLHLEARDGSAEAQWQAIDGQRSCIVDAMDWHLVSSATSGIMTPTLLGIFANGETPTDAHHSEVASVLSGADGVESADIADGAERIQAAVLMDPVVAQKFAEMTNEEAGSWLASDASGEPGREYRRYLDRHGHRAIKELELRQPEWREDPIPLIASLRVSVRSRCNGDARPMDSAPVPRPADARRYNLAIRLLTKLAHQTVRSREETKSGLVAVTAHFKRAYRELAKRMVGEGLLPDEDAVFFLTHQELGALISRSGADLARSAIDRRSVFDQQASLQFPDVFAGHPVPVIPELPDDMEGKFVTGTSVSRGTIVGVARVVRTPAEAEALMHGEILVAPITDVGWTPYFGLISGLVTDIGSAVSHGAVVAREFGLPAIVNTRFATQVFETGDRIVLDADNGLVRLANPDDL